MRASRCELADNSPTITAALLMHVHIPLAALTAPLRDLLAYRDRPQLFALLIYQAITTTGFTLLIPLVSVHFVGDVGMAAATVGMALALRQISQQGLTFIGGMLAGLFPRPAAHRPRRGAV